jgi:phosphatidylserine decarboxylase
MIYTALANIIPGLYLIKNSDTVLKYKLSFTRHASYYYGRIFQLQITDWIRPHAFHTFGWIFGVNFDEIKAPLDSFKTMNEFFVRELKEGARPIAETPVTSPADSKVLGIGEVSVDMIEHIKGKTYSLSKFMTGTAELTSGDYLKGLLKNKDNKLYYVTLYLAPGDYHRFHSPADWTVKFRRHLHGYLLGVFTWNLRRKKDIYVMNERVIYFGEWEHGAMAYALVGAYNVGSIEVYTDETLLTNVRRWKETTPLLFEEKVMDAKVGKGEEFGRFNCGSTVVLFFEAPDARILIKSGDTVKVGQALAEIIKVNKENE